MTQQFSHGTVRFYRAVLGGELEGRDSAKRSVPGEDASMSVPHTLITPEQFDAVLFDLDGVLTATAKVHALCWKRMFDTFLRQYAERQQAPFVPFDLETIPFKVT